MTKGFSISVSSHIRCRKTLRRRESYSRIVCWYSIETIRTWPDVAKTSTHKYVRSSDDPTMPQIGDSTPEQQDKHSLPQTEASKRWGWPNTRQWGGFAVEQQIKFRRIQHVFQLPKCCQDWDDYNMIKTTRSSNVFESRVLEWIVQPRLALDTMGSGQWAYKWSIHRHLSMEDRSLGAYLVNVTCDICYLPEFQ